MSTCVRWFASAAAAALVSLLLTAAAKTRNFTPVPWSSLQRHLMLCESGGAPEAVNESATERHWNGE